MARDPDLSTEADIVERFVGRSAAYMHQEIERQLGRNVDWDAEFEFQYRRVFERGLAPVRGVIDALSTDTKVRGVEWKPRKDAIHLRFDRTP